ncbi:MAG TPA: DUF3135 domain-containing protein [Limnobacter sp.]|nr:DUF3135 domain-containing protein [Limnobacter sp.]
MTHFDFKEWADLYQVDPAAFELRREAVLADYVASVDESRRKLLEHTLFRIRMTRERAKSPLQAAMEASNLMWESFGKLREEVGKLESTLNTNPMKTNSLRLVSGGTTGNQSPAALASELPVEHESPTPTGKVIAFKASGKRAH